MEGEHVDGSGKLKLKSVYVFRRPSHQRCLLPLCDGGRTRRSALYIIRVSKALHGDVCFRYAMEGGHGGLMVRKGPAAGSNVSSTAAVRWSGRHEALSSHIGVLQFWLCFLLVLSPRCQLFFDFFLTSLDR